MLMLFIKNMTSIKNHKQKSKNAVLLFFLQITNCSFVCQLSTPTIHYVKSCPRNETEWQKAAKQKNCESLAPHQNCTEPKNFRFHCLLNQWRNATLEVCAKIYYLPGMML